MHFPQYFVDGIAFADADLAEAFAMNRAALEKRPVCLVEKLDDLTPAHRVATYIA